MHRLSISLVILLCATSVASAGHTYRSDCVLEVKGVSYIKGPCEITMDKDGSLQVSTIKGPAYFAQVSPEADGPANAFWNGTAGFDHAQTFLGEVAHQGPCWVNTQVKICAAPPGMRKQH